MRSAKQTTSKRPAKQTTSKRPAKQTTSKRPAKQTTVGGMKGPAGRAEGVVV